MRSFCRSPEHHRCRGMLRRMQVFYATTLLCSVGRLKKYSVLLHQHLYLAGDVAGCGCLPGDQQNVHCRRDRIVDDVQGEHKVLP